MKRLIIIILSFLVIATCASAQQKKNQLRFGMHFESGGGISSSSLYDFVNKTLAQLAATMGTDIKIFKYASNSETIESLLNGETNSTFMWPQFAHYIQGAEKDIEPVATYTVLKKRKASYCMWHSNKRTVTSFKDLQGGSLILDYFTPLDLGEIRLFLTENGVDMPLWKVFPSFVGAPSQNSAFIAVAMGDADFFWAKSDGEYYLKMINPGVASQLTKSLCTEEKYARGTIVINKKGLSEEDFNIIKKSTLDFFKNMKKLGKTDGTITAITKYMEMAKIEVIPANKNEFEVEFREYELIKKKGWLNELEYIASVMNNHPDGKPVQVKPDMDYCKKKCGDDYKCIVSCTE